MWTAFPYKSIQNGEKSVNRWILSVFVVYGAGCSLKMFFCLDSGGEMLYSFYSIFILNKGKLR